MIREESCKPCGGDQSLIGVHECHVHGVCSTNRYSQSQPETICLTCRDQRDADPIQQYPTTKAWSYGITTTPHRKRTLLPKTIASLAAAGFDKPILFVDGCPPHESYSEFSPLETVRRSVPLGNFGNWWSAALHLYLRNPFADLYAVFEDDLLISRGARAYLEATATNDGEYYSLFTWPANARRVKSKFQGWFLSNQAGNGAVGLVFRRQTFIKLLTHPAFAAHRSQTDRVRGLERVDGAVGGVMSACGVLEMVHQPSICYHTGEKSVMNHSVASWQTKTFAGENFDLMSLRGDHAAESHPAAVQDDLDPHPPEEPPDGRGPDAARPGD